VRTLLAALSTGCLLTAGCYDPTPPPPRASVPPPGTYTYLSGAPAKPMPESASAEPVRQPTNDVPQVASPSPADGAFVDIYQRVGSPRMTLFVNQSLQGPMARTESYLAPGQYDESAARRIDYDVIENVMTAALAANGKTTMVAPRLTDSQISGLQNADPNVLKALGKDSGVDVLIQVQARPLQQTPQGLQIRLIAEAINTSDGDTVGRAVEDVPPPLEKATTEIHARLLARKLLSDMSKTWSSPRPTEQKTPAPMQPSTPSLSPPASTQPVG